VRLTPGVLRSEEVPSTYVPWYSTKFRSVSDVAAHWRTHVDDYPAPSAAWRDTFRARTELPPEVREAVAANLTILKSPTVMRQHDGRRGAGRLLRQLGCCPGSCAHVWKLRTGDLPPVPRPARGMRETAFGEGQDENGRQAFRVNLPISPGGGKFDASDGHCGEIMKAHRGGASPATTHG
jgi:hypothetical protein